MNIAVLLIIIIIGISISGLFYFLYSLIHYREKDEEAQLIIDKLRGINYSGTISSGPR